ncbi:Cyclic di-GMP phosphodiesterase CdgJ [bioreactor metagenome]|uniref:Cyclic di-GMP phosphodiesterase CdgJ n=1 Tax=bioreactor metagenome TaxID=1076179 RepID=A0A645E0E3_9ZZZZ
MLQIDHDFLLLPDAMHLVHEYHSEGYRVALIGFDFNSMYLAALNTVDYVKLSFQSDSYNHKSAVEVLRQLGKETVGYHVDSKEAYMRATELGIQHMQGSYIASTLPSSIHSLNLIHSNFFRLVVAITREEPSFIEIEEIIVRDVTLTYSLLKLVNSAFFALRSRVTSVQQALVILGLEQLKQWIYLLSFNPDGKAPIEFIKTSLLRASFCEALCVCIKDMPVPKSEAYLMGLFSTLGALLQIPLEQALAEISLCGEVRDALLTGAGRCGMLFQLVLSYEKADWHRISEYAEQLGIPQSVLSQKYLECMEKVNGIWRQITQVL